MSFDSFVRLCFLKLVFECINNLAPEPLHRYIQRQDSNRVTRSTVEGNCRIQYRRTTFGQSALSIKGCKLWNTLPTEIKSLTNLKTVTQKVKCWLKRCD